MLTCTPKGICSYDYIVSGEDRSAEVVFDWLTETGSILTPEADYEVTKAGPMIGHWTLRGPLGSVAQAEKLSMFTRTFNISTDEVSLRLEAETAFGRTMRLTGDGYQLEYAPDHALTRRASIKGEWKKYPVVLFGLWLSALLWKRSQQSSAGS